MKSTRILVLLVFIIGLSQSLWSQSAANTGQIVGLVVDQSGGAVAGVRRNGSQ